MSDSSELKLQLQKDVEYSEAPEVRALFPETLTMMNALARRNSPPRLERGRR